MQTRFGCEADHVRQVAVEQRFAADEKQVTYLVLDRNADDILGLFQGDHAALVGLETSRGESAKTALGVAEVGDGKLQITRAAILQDLAEETPRAGLRFHNRAERRQRRLSRIQRRWCICNCAFHLKGALWVRGAVVAIFSSL